jgi:hypothetical protein
MADVLEQFFGGGTVATPPPPTKPTGGTRITPEDQASRDRGALAILQNELKASQDRFAAATDPQAKARHQADIAGLQREIGRMSKTATPVTNTPAVIPSAAPAAQQAPAETSADPLEAFLSGKPVTAAPPAAQPSQPIAENTTSTQEGTMGAYVPRRQPVSNVRQILGKVLQKGFEAKQALPGFLASSADVVGSAPSALAGVVGYGAGRLFGGTPEEASASSQKVAGAIAQPVGRITGLAETPAYKESLPTVVMDYIGKNIGEGAESIAKKFGVNKLDVENAINAGLMTAGAVAPKAIGLAKKTAKEIEIVRPNQAPTPTPQSGMVSAGAAAVPDATTIKQALSVATPELQQALSSIPPEKVNIPTLQRHIEADSLPVPVRLTEGQATGDIVKLSREQNRRGQDPSLAQRFNEQNGQLVENLGMIREKAAPDVYGSKTIENSQGIIDTYKSMDAANTAYISKAYKALEDANGGQFPVDGVKLATNAETMLGKKLKTEFLPPSIKTQLERFKAGEPMTFEQFEAMRTNLASEIRKAERSGDGNAAQASSIVRQALEDLPMQGTAAAELKPLADRARSLAKQRFDMLKKDPAYKAAVDDLVPADKFIDKFVINGVNKNINTMVQHLGKDSPAHQHMAAGTVNWLKDKAGIIDETGNFSQAGYNKALKKLDDVKNLQEIFNPEAASQLKTLGNVARYTQAQPRGAFVNNSNTLVGALAEKAAGLTKAGIEKGLNVAVPGLQLGTSVMEMRARRAAEAETRKSLETGAGTKQTGKNKIQDLGK